MSIKLSNNGTFMDHPLAMKIGHSISRITLSLTKYADSEWSRVMHQFIVCANNFQQQGDVSNLTKFMQSEGLDSICEWFEKTFDYVAMINEDDRGDVLDDCCSFLDSINGVNSMTGDEDIFQFAMQIPEIFQKRLVREISNSDASALVNRLQRRITITRANPRDIRVLANMIDTFLQAPPASNVIKDRQGNLPEEKIEVITSLGKSNVIGAIS